jgi:hypothetical protein
VLAHEAVDDEDDEGERGGHAGDRLILTAQKRFGPRLDGIGNLAHGRGAGIPRKHPSNEIAGEGQP